MAVDDERTLLMERERVSAQTKLAYAMGHIFNDLAAATWFSYTLLFLHRIVLFEPVAAGAMLLLGQTVDALATPIFGVLVDRYHDKKTWHILGSSLVAVSFPVIFGSFVDASSPLAMPVYVTSIAVFQTGWAAVQISHLSMIPALSGSTLVRAELTAIRYSAQVASAVIVFVIAWTILPTSGDNVAQVTQRDAYKFRTIALICTAVGLAATIGFHALLKIEDDSKARTENTSSSGEYSSARRPRDLGVTLLLRVALLYVASRLFITLATVYLPLYTEETGVGGKQALATVPLISYLSSFAAALLLKYLNRICGAKLCYLLGALVGVISAVVTEFATGNAITLYAVAILIGTGSSVTMVTALSVTAELIGPRTERSALVYAVVTFLDKVVTGLAVILIEKMRCREEDLCPNYNRNALALVCVTSMGLGLIGLMSVARCII